MDRIHRVDQMHQWADASRRAGQTLALVPTMGALHEGHLALVREAKQHAEKVVVSIFVNPTQFAPGEDYERYPRTLDADAARLSELEVDAVFAPTVDEMYPDQMRSTWVAVEGLDEHLCGRHRPGHFRGVATVVTKLFNCCKPDVAVFGKKDAQQFVIIRRLVQELRLDVQIVGVDTVREADGLALSSRNQYLSPEHRKQAVVLSEAVAAARERVLQGEQQPQALVETMRQHLGRAPAAEVEYAEVVGVDALAPLDRIEAGDRVLVAVAVYFGSTRLIDNAFVEAPAG